jgi:DNA-binding winged helix-turn-helix (wHTH) protein/TolB-like protein
MTGEDSPQPVDLARATDFALHGVRVRPSVRRIGDGAAQQTLEPRVMQVLVALARRFGEVVSRDALIATCWDGRIVGDEAITVCITKLRRIGLAHGAFRIETVPRVGYRMLEPEPSARGDRAPPRRRSTRALVLAAIAVAALAAGAVVYALRKPAPALPPPVPIVAVAPFKALSDDKAASAFARVADTEIAGGLQERLLQVTPAWTRGQRVDFIVGGSVSTAAGRSRVRTTLAEPGSQIVLWSAEYEGPSAEPLAQPIAARLASVIELASDARRSAGPRLQARTLALYLQTCDSAGLADSEIGHSLDRVLLDAPQLSRARLVRARSRLRESFFYPRAAFEVARSQAVADARETLRRDPRATESYAVLALALDGRRWSEREALLARSLATTPSVDSQDAMIRFLASTGRMDEAARRARTIATSGRVWGGVSWQVDYVIYLSGAKREALLYVNRDLAARPSDALLKLSKLLIAVGSDPAAIGEVVADPPRGIVAAIRPGTVDAFADFAAARQDGSETARQAAIRRIADAVRAQRLLPDQAIPMLANLGGLDEAFDLARRLARTDLAVRTGAVLSTGFLFGPDTAAMRRDARFTGLMRDFGLLQYWRRSGHWPDFCDTEPSSVCAAMKRSA